LLVNCFGNNHLGRGSVAKAPIRAPASDERTRTPELMHWRRG
jgi:hypothetical protein